MKDIKVQQLTVAQIEALKNICARYHVSYNPNDYLPGWDLPPGYFCGWVGGNDHNSYNGVNKKTIYIGVSPTGEVSS